MLIDDETYVAEWCESQKAPHLMKLKYKLEELKEGNINSLNWPPFKIGTWEECTKAIQELTKKYE